MQNENFSCDMHQMQACDRQKIPAGLCAFNFEQFSHCQAVFPQNEFNFQYQIYSSTTTAAAASE